MAEQNDYFSHSLFSLEKQESKDTYYIPKLQQTIEAGEYSSERDIEINALKKMAGKNNNAFLMGMRNLDEPVSLGLFDGYVKKKTEERMGEFNSSAWEATKAGLKGFAQGPVRFIGYAATNSLPLIARTATTLYAMSGAAGGQESADKWLREANKGIEAWGNEIKRATGIDDASEVESIVGNAIGSVWGSVAIGGTVGKAAVAPMFGVSALQDTYVRQREAGTGMGESLVRGAIHGTAETALESLQLNRIFGNLAKKSKPIAIVKDLFENALQEGTQQGAELATNWNIDNRELSEKLQEVGAAIVGGAVASLAGSVGGNILNRKTIDEVCDLMKKTGHTEEEIKTVKENMNKIVDTDELQQAANQVAKDELTTIALSYKEQAQAASEAIVVGLEDTIKRNELVDMGGALSGDKTEGMPPLYQLGDIQIDTQKNPNIGMVLYQADQEGKPMQTLGQVLAWTKSKLNVEQAKKMNTGINAVYNKTYEQLKAFGQEESVADANARVRSAMAYSIAKNYDVDVEQADTMLGGIVQQKASEFGGQGQAQYQDVAERINEIDVEEKANGVPEYTAPTININGVERQTTNSNGDPIAKSEKSLRYFYNWFGDSKFVDEQGRPLVVYHGTRQRGITEFKSPYADKLIFFAYKKEFADDWAKNAPLTEEQTKIYRDMPNFSIEVSKKYREKYGENWAENESLMQEARAERENLKKEYLRNAGIEEITMPVYLKAENTFKPAEHWDLVIDEIEKYYDTDYRDENADAQTKEYLKQIQDGKWIFFEHENVIKKIRELGFDSIELEEISGQGITTIAVFEGNNQIKSTSNRGTYSLTEDNIYLQSAYAGSRVDYDRPSLEAIGSGEGNQAHGWGLYYALNKDVAEEYRAKLTEPDVSYKYNGNITLSNSQIQIIGRYGKQKAIEMATRDLAFKEQMNFAPAVINEQKNFIRRLESVNESDIEKVVKEYTGQVHEVDIPAPDFLLDEQKSFGEQSDYVKEKIKELLEKEDIGIPQITRYWDFVDKVRDLFGEDGVSLFDRIFTLESMRNDFELTESQEKELENLWAKELELEKSLGEKAKDFDANEIYTFVNPSSIDYSTNGRGIYDKISEQLGSDKAASQILEKYGIKGITYDGRQDGRCFVIFNPNDVKVIRKFYQDETSPRGAYYKGAVYLFENANESTFVHEMAHSYMDVLERLANGGNAQAQNDLNVIRKWLGKKQGESFTKADWERFARGFEMYMREGKSPNEYLGGENGVFARFRDWLMHIYTGIKSIKVKNEKGKEEPVNINSQIKRFYDEMLGGQDIDKVFDTAEKNQQSLEVLDSKLKQFAEAQQKLAEEKAKLVREMANNVKPDTTWANVKDWGKNVLESAKELPTNVLQSSYERLAKIDARLGLLVQKAEQSQGLRIKKWADQIQPFYESFNKLSNEDKAKVQYFLLNQQWGDVEDILGKEGTEAVHKVLEEIYNELVDSGVEVGYQDNYFPRAVLDYDGLLQEMGLTYPSLRKEMEEALGKDATPQEQAEWLDKHIMGFKGSVSLNQNRNTKERKLDLITDRMAKYYKPSMETLVDYMGSMAKLLSMREAFGRDIEYKESTAEESIGKIINRLFGNNELSKKEIDEVRDVLSALYLPNGIGNKFLQAMRQYGYATKLSYSTTIRQFADIGMMMKVNGVLNTLDALFHPDKRITLENLGIDPLGEEFQTSKKDIGGKIANIATKWKGINWADAIMKNAFMRGNYKALQKLAKTPDKFHEKYDALFGDETDTLIKDLNENKISEPVKVLLFHEISKIQPISRSSMPTAYLQNPNGRVFYMFKTFSLHRAEYMVSELSEDFRKGDLKKAGKDIMADVAVIGWEGLVELLIAFLKYGWQALAAKEVIETFAGSGLGVFGLNKHQALQISRGQVGDFFQEMVGVGTPLDDIGYMIRHYDDDDKLLRAFLPDMILEPLIAGPKPLGKKKVR